MSGIDMRDDAGRRGEGAAAGATRTRRRALIVLAALALTIASAWVIQGEVVGKGAEAPDGASAPGYGVSVTRGGALLRRFTLSDLEALPATSLTVDGKEQNGPALPVVLSAAGAGAYESVTVQGVGVRDSGSLTLAADQVDDRVVLDFSVRGTVKVCGAGLEWSEWVRDVTEIRVD